MRLGSVLNGYRVVTEPSNTNAGMSQWAHVEREGERFFMKMYLAPKYPTPNSPGSPEGKERRRRDCERFEARHLTIAKRLASDAPGGGHLVTTLAFFRVGPCYYKVTRLVDVDDRVVLGECEPHVRAVALRSLLFSLKLMHDQGVVHGDLKPENVLFQRTAAGAVTCKLIDFDEAYLTGEPPDAPTIVGDPLFYSPELFRYVKQDPSVTPAHLTTAADIFALGLLLHALLTGAFPTFDADRFGYPCEAVAANAPLELHQRLTSRELRTTLSSMLMADPAARPNIDDVIARVRTADLGVADPSYLPPTASDVESGDEDGLDRDAVSATAERSLPGDGDSRPEPAPVVDLTTTAPTGGPGAVPSAATAPAPGPPSAVPAAEAAEAEESAGEGAPRLRSTFSQPPGSAH